MRKSGCSKQKRRVRARPRNGDISRFQRCLKMGASTANCIWQIAESILSFNRNDETGSAELADRWDWLTSLSSSGLERWGADRQIGGPAIGENLPGAGGLSREDDQIFAPLFAALTHHDGHEHLAAAEIECYIAQHFDAQRFHFHVAQSGFEQRDKKFPDRRQAANGRNAGADESRVGGVEFEQIIDVPGVAGLRPVLDNLAGIRFGAAAGGSARRTGSNAPRGGRVGL